MYTCAPTHTCVCEGGYDYQSINQLKKPFLIPVELLI